MLTSQNNEEQTYTPLSGERTLCVFPSRISLSLTAPAHFPGRQQTPFSLSSPTGKLYLTNRRVIYLPDKATERLQSFAASYLNIHDSHIAAPWFGPNAWCASLQPVRGGGIDALVVELKLTFKDGGAFEFQTQFEKIKERMQQVAEVARMSGDAAASNNGIDGRNVDLEELPRYQEESHGPLISPVAPSPVVLHAQNTGERPTEPPPGYEEVQRAGVQDELDEMDRRLQ